MIDQNTTPQLQEAVSGPRIVVHENQTIIGMGLRGSDAIVRVYGDERDGHLGVLPEKIYLEPPHIDEPQTITTEDNGNLHKKEVVTLGTASKEYLTRIKDEFRIIPWLTDAESLARHDNIDNMEAIVMAVARDIDTIGSGQAEHIGEITGWGTDCVQRILEALLMSKQRYCRREQNEKSEEE